VSTRKWGSRFRLGEVEPSFKGFLASTAMMRLGLMPIKPDIGHKKFSIAVLLQASQTAVVFYHFQVKLLALFQDISGFNCLLPFFKFNCNCNSGLLRLQLFSTFLYQVQRGFLEFYLVINIKLFSLSN
jgi:hypothetical protein